MMPSNAPTKACDEGRHDACGHRLGGLQEGGVTLKLCLPGLNPALRLRVPQRPAPGGAAPSGSQLGLLHVHLEAGVRIGQAGPFKNECVLLGGQQIPGVAARQ
jgi:hypothetical protein